MLLPDRCRVICIVPPVLAFVLLRAPCVSFPDCAISVNEAYDVFVLSKYAVVMLHPVEAPDEVFTLMKP